MEEDEGIPEMETVDIDEVNDQATAVSDRLERVLSAVRWVSKVNSSIQESLEEADAEVQRLVEVSENLGESLGDGEPGFRDLNEIKDEVDHERNIQDNIDSVIADLQRLSDQVPKMVEALEKAKEEDSELESDTRKFLRRYN